MKNTFNFLVYLAVFWTANHFFSEYVSIKNTETLLIAVVLMFVFSLLYAYAFILSALLMAIGIGCITTPIMTLGIFFIVPLELYLASTYVPGFHINGFWTYFILTCLLSIFAFSPSTSSSSTKKSTETA